MCSACDTNTEQTNSITLTIQSRNGNLQAGCKQNSVCYHQQQLKTRAVSPNWQTLRMTADEETVVTTSPAHVPGTRPQCITHGIAIHSEDRYDDGLWDHNRLVTRSRHAICRH